MGKTKIEWAERTWNPVTGCTKVSAGCRNCYAERMAKRLAGRCGYNKDDPFKITLHPDRLTEPLKWRKPQMVFVCSMGDLFHEDVAEAWLDRVFAVMALCLEHTFMILTKRPERMKTYLERFDEYVLDDDDEWRKAKYRVDCDDDLGETKSWHKETLRLENAISSSLYALRTKGYLPNVWVGVTTENQETAEQRIPILLQMTAEKRFVSVEPMLEEVTLGKWLLSDGWVPSFYNPDNKEGVPSAEPTNEYINWVICGGETGPGARPMHPDWVDSLKDQCVEANVPFFFKSWGDLVVDGRTWNEKTRETEFMRVGKKQAGRTLDNRTWDEMPEVD